jgi:hypothetical protein
VIFLSTSVVFKGEALEPVTQGLANIFDKTEVDVPKDEDDDK